MEEEEEEEEEDETRKTVVGPARRPAALSGLVSLSGTPLVPLSYPVQ